MLDEKKPDEVVIPPAVIPEIPKPKETKVADQIAQTSPGGQNFVDLTKRLIG